MCEATVFYSLAPRTCVASQLQQARLGGMSEALQLFYSAGLAICFPLADPIFHIDMTSTTAGGMQCRAPPGRPRLSSTHVTNLNGCNANNNSTIPQPGVPVWYVARQSSRMQ